METPEQQRRSTIGQSAQKLRQLGLDFDAVDLADMLWLAQFIELERTVRPAVPAQSAKSGRSNRRGATGTDGSEGNRSDSTFNLYVDDRQTEQTTESESTANSQPEPPKGIPFPVPAAPALRTRLDLARSLRPLMRKVPAQNRVELDEAATVTQIAETQMMLPVVRAQPERWLNLDLVVEDSKTTVIWERTIAELQHLMEYQGAFRTVRTWRLAVPDAQTAQPDDVKLFPRWQERSQTNGYQRPRSPRELLDPGSRRLILVVTDCTSVLWQRGIIHEILWQWAATQPLSIVQLFPERLWPRTTLSDGYPVRLGATAPGLPSARLAIEGLPSLPAWAEWPDGTGNEAEPDTSEPDLVPSLNLRSLVLPIVSLDPKAMSRWARVIAGGGETLTPGRCFELKPVQQQEQAADRGEPEQLITDVRTARQRVALFKATALAPAKALAQYMAATPVSLPVIDLLRDEFVPEAQQEHVAEVLLSGLLQRVDAADEDKCRYEFFGDRDPAETTERVRYLLLDDVPTTHTVNVLNRLSQLIKDQAGNTLNSFAAFLAAFEASGEALGAGALPLAAVGLEVLHRLGGPHARLAQRYEQVLQPTPQPSQTQSSDDDLLLVDLEYEVAKLINFPPIQSCEYESATITAILDRFDFETAKLERETGLLGLRQEWVIRRRQAFAWGYIERLERPFHLKGLNVLVENADFPPFVSLDMVAIPGGRFRMGGTRSETASHNNERPQHEVTLEPFYLGRYPITQEQWRIVAGYDRVDQDLDPDPSYFKGDKRPVEQVSWDDAQEFCRRLSAKTGKIYCLPSEAQWEYACRASPMFVAGWSRAGDAGGNGAITSFHFGDTLSPDLVNYNGGETYRSGPKGTFRGETTPVGTFPANDWGLHDMHGNIWEWCGDDYHSNYEGAPTDGSAWVDANREETYRMLRGGSWRYNPLYCRSAYRYFNSRDNRVNFIGFRVCCAWSVGLAVAPARTLS